MADKVLSDLFDMPNNVKITKKGVVMDNDNYRMTSLDDDMTDDDGNSLDFFDKIKEMCGDKEMILMAVPRKKTRNLRECFGTPISCANCVSKGQETRFPDELKRCSACHVLSYCTEECQREHWLLSHSKICKALCGKKGHGKALHDKETCLNCDTKGHTKCKINNDRNSLEMACVMDFAQALLLGRLWRMFGYHGLVKGSFQGQTPCRCTTDNKFEEMRDCTYLMDPPFILGEISGKYLGWIDTSLSYLGLLWGAWSRKYEDEITQYDLKNDVKQIKSFIFEMRGGYWYYATIERSREMTDYLFGQWAIQQAVEFAKEENGHMANVERAFRTPNKQHPGKKVWWETFIFHLSEFFRKIKDIRYLILDFQKFPDDELHMLKHSYFDAMWNLSQPTSVMLPIKRTDGAIEESFLVQLPEGTKCMICYHNLGGKKGQWYLQYGEVSKMECMIWQTEPNAPVEDLLALRYGFDLPVIFFFNSEGYTVCCSGTYKKHPCLEKMIQLKTEWHQILTRQSFNFGLQSEKCHACLKYSLHCHRCSECKSVRYCSNGCLQDDWQFHEKICSPTLKKMEDKKLKKSKKYKKETAKEKIFEVAKWLSKCDPSMRFTIENWVKKYSDKDALLTYILQDSKDIEAPKKKSKKKGKTEEVCEMTNEVKSINVNGPAYIRKPMAGKGYGLVATRTIKAGNPVAVCREIIIVPNHLGDFETVSRIIQEFSNLSDEDKELYLTLNDKGEDFEPECNPLNRCTKSMLEEVYRKYCGSEKVRKIVRIYLHNKSNSEKDGNMSIPVPQILMNHSCAPNAAATDNDEKGRSIFALTDIQKGEEIVESYFEWDTSHKDFDKQMGEKKVRIENLRKLFGFTCCCTKCTMTGEELQENEKIRRNITSGYKKLMQVKELSNIGLKTNIDYLDIAEDLVVLLNKIPKEMVAVLNVILKTCYKVSSYVVMAGKQPKVQPKIYKQQLYQIAKGYGPFMLRHTEEMVQETKEEIQAHGGRKYLHMF